ncbi:hypothetical protein GCM10025734_05840 [Kitasatospora paranensis]
MDAVGAPAAVPAWSSWQAVSERAAVTARAAKASLRTCMVFLRSGWRCLVLGASGFPKIRTAGPDEPFRPGRPQDSAVTCTAAIDPLRCPRAVPRPAADLP